MTIDNNFRRGSKSSSSIMVGALTPVQVLQFMKTSFYLPVDVLKQRDWVVSPIRIVTGSNFAYNSRLSTGVHLHCEVERALLEQAQLVAVSLRHNKKTKLDYYVAKIWYGAAEKEPA